MRILVIAIALLAYSQTNANECTYQGATEGLTVATSKPVKTDDGRTICTVEVYNRMKGIKRYVHELAFFSHYQDLEFKYPYMYFEIYSDGKNTFQHKVFSKEGFLSKVIIKKPGENYEDFERDVRIWFEGLESGMGIGKYKFDPYDIGVSSASKSLTVGVQYFLIDKIPNYKTEVFINFDGEESYLMREIELKALIEMSELWQNYLTQLK